MSRAARKKRMQTSPQNDDLDIYNVPASSPKPGDSLSRPRIASTNTGKAKATKRTGNALTARIQPRRSLRHVNTPESTFAYIDVPAAGHDYRYTATRSLAKRIDASNVGQRKGVRSSIRHQTSQIGTGSQGHSETARTEIGSNTTDEEYIINPDPADESSQESNDPMAISVDEGDRIIIETSSAGAGEQNVPVPAPRSSTKVGKGQPINPISEIDKEGHYPQLLKLWDKLPNDAAFSSPAFREIGKILKSLCHGISRSASVEELRKRLDDPALSFSKLIKMLDGMTKFDDTTIARDFCGRGLWELVKVLKDIVHYHGDSILDQEVILTLKTANDLVQSILQLATNIHVYNARSLTGRRPSYKATLSKDAANVVSKLRPIAKLFKEELARRRDQVKMARFYSNYQQSQQQIQQQGHNPNLRALVMHDPDSQLQSIAQQSVKVSPQGQVGDDLARFWAEYKESQQQLAIQSKPKGERRQPDFEGESREGISANSAEIPHPPSVASNEPDLRAQSSHSFQKGRKGLQWTEDMDRALITSLNSYGSNSVSERYLRCLLTEQLQNLRPDHIQARALELQPSLVEWYRERGEAVPDWVASIA